MSVATQEIETVPRVEWSDFVASIEWIQSEHIALIGPTGCGKTNLAFWLLPHRKYITILATKPRDKSLSAFGKLHGYRVIRKWEKLTARKVPRRILWPNATNLQTMKADQYREFSLAIQEMYIQGAWTIYIDELWWVCQQLHLTEYVKIILQQGRSMDMSIVVATQRPSWVPLEVYDQSTHLFFWRDTDENNLKRLAGISWINARIIVREIALLPKWHVLYVNTRDGKMMVTRPPAPEGA